MNEDYSRRRWRGLITTENAALLMIAGSLYVIGHHLRLRSRGEWVKQTSAAAAPIGYLTTMLPGLRQAKATVLGLGDAGISCAAWTRAGGATSMPMVLVSTVNPPQVCSSQRVLLSFADSRKAARMLSDSGAKIAIVDSTGRAIFSTRDADPAPGVVELLASVR
jgi:hypothetical protein